MDSDRHLLASLNNTGAFRRVRSIVSKSATMRGSVTRLLRCVTSRRLRVSRRAEISLTRRVRDEQEHFALQSVISIALFHERVPFGGSWRESALLVSGLHVMSRQQLTAVDRSFLISEDAHASFLMLATLVTFTHPPLSSARRTPNSITRLRLIEQSRAEHHSPCGLIAFLTPTSWFA